MNLQPTYKGTVGSNGPALNHQLHGETQAPESPSTHRVQYRMLQLFLAHTSACNAICTTYLSKISTNVLVLPVLLLTNNI